MLRLTTIILLAASMAAPLAGCTRGCDDIQEDILEIGQEIQKKPDTAWDRARELSDLKDELEQEGCLATGPG